MDWTEELRNDQRLVTVNFWRSSRILRAWLVAFGVGLPAIVLTNERLFDGLVEAGMAKRVFGLIFIAVGLQVGAECWLKYRHWLEYARSFERSSCSSKRLVTKRIARIYFTVSLTIDLASIALLGTAGVIAIFTCIDSGTAATMTDAAAVTDAATTMPATTMPALP